MIKNNIQYKNHIARIHVENKPECHLAITNGLLASWGIKSIICTGIGTL